MSAVRVTLLLAVVLLASPVSAEPIRSRVQSWITPVPGQTPFTPGPGSYVPDSAFDLTPSVQQRIASFGPSDAWVARTGQPPDQDTVFRHEYQFLYHVRVTDLASGLTGTVTLPGSAVASWIQWGDGGVSEQELGVTLGSPSGDLVLGANRYRLDALPYPLWTPQRTGAVRAMSAAIPPTQTFGADVVLTATPGVPEPTTLVLAAGGLAAVGAGVWRRRRTG